MKPVVLIPCYQATLTPAETAALEQCRRLLGHYDCRVCQPEGLVLPKSFAGLQAECFPADRFSSIDSYNQLLLSAEFYERFQDWDYMLIYQLDAWVFRDELEDWCRQGFDYIGAPWGNAGFVEKYRRLRLIPRSSCFPWLSGLLYRNEFRVGNGGFSLRNIRAFLRVLRSNETAVSRWGGNEDLFWSFLGTQLDRSFRIAFEDRAMRFALELNPRAYVERMGGRLPFGCHAWQKYDPDFWGSFIQFSK
jgi:hypothetical protein